MTKHKDITRGDLAATSFKGGSKGQRVHTLSQPIMRQFDNGLLNLPADDSPSSPAAEQATLFDLSAVEQSAYAVGARQASPQDYQSRGGRNDFFQLQNRRYLGNKHKLLGFIEAIISAKCGRVDSLAAMVAINPPNDYHKFIFNLLYGIILFLKQSVCATIRANLWACGGLRADKWP